jgi:hypothetical protein
MEPFSTHPTVPGGQRLPCGGWLQAAAPLGEVSRSAASWIMEYLEMQVHKGALPPTALSVLSESFPALEMMPVAIVLPAHGSFDYGTLRSAATGFNPRLALGMSARPTDDGLRFCGHNRSYTVTGSPNTVTSTGMKPGVAAGGPGRLSESSRPSESDGPAPPVTRAPGPWPPSRSRASLQKQQSESPET